MEKAEIDWRLLVFLHSFDTTLYTCIMNDVYLIKLYTWYDNIIYDTRYIVYCIYIYMHV